MKTKIFLAIFTLALGGVSGYIMQQWKERAIPILQITSISFEKIKSEELIISIPDSLQKKSEDSRWFDTLGKEISYVDITKELENLSETVLALGNMTSTLPKMKKYIKKHQNDLSVEQAQKYREFIAENIDKLSLAYLTMNISALIKRNEVKFSILEGIERDNNFIPREKKTLEEIKNSLETKSEESAIIALRIVTDWYPQDLLKAISIIIERTGEQATLNREIHKELSDLIKNKSDSIENEYLLVSATLSNNGNKTISFQKYAVSSLSGLNTPIFLEAKDIKGGIVLTQGETKEVDFRSRTFLSPDLSKKLKTMYNTDFIKCKISARLLTPTNFSDEWVYSQATNLSGFNKKLELEYMDHAPAFKY